MLRGANFQLGKEAKLGELLKPITHNYQSSGRGTLKQPRLPEGISRKQSHYAQQLAEGSTSGTLGKCLHSARQSAYLEC